MTVQPSMIEPPVAATDHRSPVRVQPLMPRDPPALRQIRRERPRLQCPREHPAAVRTDDVSADRHDSRSGRNASIGTSTRP